MTTPRGRAAATIALALAVGACWAGGLVVRAAALDAPLVSDTVERGAYRVAAGAGLATAGLLLVALLSAAALRASRWLRYLTAAGLATQLALGVTAWWSSRDLEEVRARGESGWDGARDVLLLPGSWLVLALAAVAAALALRARSSRSPR